MFPQPKFGAPVDPGPNPLDQATPQLQKHLETSQNILILIRDNPKLDHVAAGLGLYLALQDLGKSVAIACSTEMRVEFNRLVGVDRISTKIGNRNLVISFPYVKDSIEKVSYHVDESNFNLVIQPKPGFPSLDTNKVSYSYSGADAQLVFIIGAQKLEDLNVFYNTERQLFDQATLVNIDSSLGNSRFATINLTWAEFSSCAEIIAATIDRLQLKLTEDIATNLLAGLNDATQNFQRFNLKASTFEAAAKLMKAGGKRPISLAGPSAFGGSPFPAMPAPTRPLPMTGFSFPPEPPLNPLPEEGRVGRWKHPASGQSAFLTLFQW